MRRSILFIALVMVALAPVWAQIGPTNPAVGYPNFNRVDIQTRSIPAGTVGDPGSHLTYIIDTGVNGRKLFGPEIKDKTSVPLVDLANFITRDQDKNIHGIYQSFVSITNTHPTAAVTVHFRYYNDNCDDVLDFLVVLTCNDTLIFDPFNFVIPGSGGVNTKERLLSLPGESQVFDPISTKTWGSGRFLITAAASGTSTDIDDASEILFPFELGSGTGVADCNMFYKATQDFSLPTQDQTLLGRYAADTDEGRVGNVGTHSGLVSDNLHVFNASQISFNYLIGHLTTAQPATPGLDQVSWGHTAWARPTVNLTQVTAPNDGDATQVATGYLILGSEIGNTSNVRNPLDIPPNMFYLRNEVHGGDINAATIGGFSLFGALGTMGLHIAPTTDQIIHLLSVSDDYNGSNNPAVGVFQDLSANVSPAFTTYVLQIYDNNEDLLQFDIQAPLNVSPPRPGAVVDLKAVCFCLRTFLTSTVSATTNVDDITIAEMVTIFGNQVTAGLGDFDGLLKAVPPDQSGGWIRFVRDNTNVVHFDRTVNTAIGGPFTIAAPPAEITGVGPGTASVGQIKYSDDTVIPSFLTLGDYVLKFEGFGAAWYLQAVAQDPAVSSVGTETGRPR